MPKARLRNGIRRPRKLNPSARPSYGMSIPWRAWSTSSAAKQAPRTSLSSTSAFSPARAADCEDLVPVSAGLRLAVGADDRRQLLRELHPLLACVVGADPCLGR